MCARSFILMFLTAAVVAFFGVGRSIRADANQESSKVPEVLTNTRDLFLKKWCCDEHLSKKAKQEQEEYSRRKTFLVHRRDIR